VERIIVLTKPWHRLVGHQRRLHGACKVQRKKKQKKREKKREDNFLHGKSHVQTVKPNAPTETKEEIQQ